MDPVLLEIVQISVDIDLSGEGGLLIVSERVISRTEGTIVVVR